MQKISEYRQYEFEHTHTLRDPPSEAGCDAPAWTPALVRAHFEETDDIEYSITSCRRLMKEAGLSYQKPPRTAAEADSDEQDMYDEAIEKSDRRWTPR